jgi:hypothetical protein
MENAEALFACYIMKFVTFTGVSFNEFEKALVDNECTTVKDLSKVIKPKVNQIQVLYLLLLIL